MSLIEAAIRISDTPSGNSIDVYYGIGFKRVPKHCHYRLRGIEPAAVKECLELLQTQIKQEMPDVAIKVLMPGDPSNPIPPGMCPKMRPRNTHSNPLDNRVLVI